MNAIASPPPGGEGRLVAEVGIGLVLGFVLVAFMASFASLLFTREQSRSLGAGWD